MSEAIAMVRKGATLTVTDRKTEVAKISGVEAPSLKILHRPKGRFQLPKLSGVKLDVDPVDYLLEDRARRS